ncbi:MAG: AAA family ATPase [Actinoplanes sp.]
MSISRRWVTAGVVLVLIVVVLVLVVTSPDWWVKLDTRYRDDDEWDWVERLSWLAAIIVALAAFVAWLFHRPGPSSAQTAVPEHAGSQVVPADPRALISAPIPAPADGLINQEGGRLQLESGLAATRSTLIMVAGPPGAGKSTLVECVLRELDLWRETSVHPIRWQGGFDAKALLDAVEGSNVDLRPEEDVLERLIAALEDGDARQAVVWVDGAQVLVDPDTNRFKDLRLEEALSIVTGSRPRRPPDSRRRPTA